MSTAGIIGLLGLKTSPNPLTQRPGALARADNVVLTPALEAQQRRGQEVSTVFGEAGDKAFQMAQSAGCIFVHNGPAGGLDGTDVHAVFGASAVDIGHFSALAPAVQRMKFAELAKSICFTTSVGLQRIDAPATPATAAAVLAAGVPRPGDFHIATTFLAGNPDDNGTWFPKNAAVGYRLVIGRKDTNGTVRLSAPNGRMVVINPADVVASLTRTGGTTVTATVASHNFNVGDVLQVTPGSTDFPAATNYTVTDITETTVVWLDAGANVTLAAQTLDSGAKTTAMRALLPSNLGIRAGDFVQLCRTLATSTADEDPGDEEFVAFEQNITVDDVTARQIVVPDTTPESFLGAPLYTNAATGQGIAFEHSTPPLMQDVTVFDGRLFAVQTTDRHTMDVRLLGTGSPNGLQSGDLLAVDKVVYTLAGEVVTEFLPSRNIQETVANLAELFSSSLTVSLTGRSIANGSSPTGQLRLERRQLTDGIFYAATSRASAWQDPLPTISSVVAADTSRTAGVVTVETLSAHGLLTGANVVMAYDAIGGEDSDFPAGVKNSITVTDSTHFTYVEAGADATLTSTYFAFAATYGSTQLQKPLRFSELGEPEAWPTVNAPKGLPDGATALRAKALNGSLYVFLQHGDIYTASGSYPYSVLKFDGTASLVAPDTLEEHAGRLYCLTTQGLCAISPSGVEVMSLDVDDALRRFVIKLTANGATALPFGVSYETDRQFQLWLPSEDADPSNPADLKCIQAYIFHSDVRGFTRWVLDRTCGLVYRTQDLLYMGTTDERLRKETKTLSWRDAADKGADLTYDVIDNGTLKVSDDRYAGLDIHPGDVVQFGDGSFAAITGVSADIITTDIPGFNDSSPGSVPFWQAFCPLTVGWLPMSDGSPGIEKHRRDFQLHFNLSCVLEAKVNCTTERTAGSPPEKLTTTIIPGDWVAGTTITDALSTVRGGIGVDAQRGAILDLEVTFGDRVGSLSIAYPTPRAFTQFKLLGLSLTGEPISEKTPR